MSRDHYTMDNFEVHVGRNNNAQTINIHNPHFDHYGTWNLLHGKFQSLIDVVQPSNGMTANVNFGNSYECFPCPMGKPPTHLDPIKIYRGDDAETVWRLRSDIPYLSKIEISDYRNSFYQNLSLCMLSRGYHRAFSELYHLIDKQEKEREEAGPDSVLWSMSPISMQEDKLTLLKDCLCTAEDNFRVEDHLGIYEGYLRLSQYFMSYPEDKWLVDHFLRYCWLVSKKIVDDDNLKHAEANYYLGLAIEENKNYNDAFQYFHTLYVLSKKKIWKNQNNRLLFTEACEHLANIRLEMAEIFVDNFKNAEVTQKISYLREAFDYSKESGNKKLEGKCGYKLGVAYLNVDKSDVAINYLMQFYNISKSIKDDQNIYIACEELAKVFKIQKKFEECIKFLEEFSDVAERSLQRDAHSRACRALGDIYNILGEFSKASIYFSRSFGLSKSINDGSKADEARVLFGVSLANNIYLSYKEHVYILTRTTIRRILTWKKDCRIDTSGIGNPINDKIVETLGIKNPNRNIFEYIGAYPKL